MKFTSAGNNPFVKQEILTETGVDSLCNWIKQNNGEKILDISGFNLTLERIKKIADALIQNTTLEVIKLSQCGLGDKGVELVTEALKGNRSVRELWLNGNHIGDDGAEHIGELLRDNKVLTGIFLADNSIEWNGVMHIVWQMNPEIHKRYFKQLDLEKNPIDYFGACYVAEMLKYNNTLQWLKIGVGHLDDKGFKAIIEALKINKGLRYFSFKNDNKLSEFTYNGNEVGKEGWEALRDALKENRTLMGCNLPKDEIDEEVWNEIAFYTRRNEQNHIRNGLGNKLLPLGRHVMPGGVKIPGGVWAVPMTEALANNLTGTKELVTLLWVAKLNQVTQREKRELDQDTSDEESTPEKKTCFGIKPQSLLEHAADKSLNNFSK